VLAALGSAVLVLGSAGVGVNAYFEYFRTLGEAIGGPVPDEETLAAADAADGLVPAQGAVVSATLPGTVSGFAARDALVYLPPVWFARPRPALPVVVLLHGSPGSPGDWTEGGQAQATADAWAAQHRGVAPIIVMPDSNGSLTDDTECVDGPVGRVETYLTVDVPAAVQKMFGTQPPGPRWAVVGLSEGGSCAIMLALRHPRLFSTFADFSGLLGPRLSDTNADTADTVAELFGGSQQEFADHDPATLLRAGRFPGMGGWFEVGATDADPLAAARELAPLAAAAGIDTCLVVVVDGAHTFDVWSSALRSSLPWVAARLGLVPADVSMTRACQPLSS
jgi:S-formylglutathione hydrolase FrmB